MSNKPWVGKSALIIDDSAGVRDELTRVFGQAGLVVKGTAANGVIGLELLAKLKPDVVSIDIIMPEMDGIECYRKVQQVAPGTVCIMISWLAGEPKILENLKDVIPAHLFQTKPVSAFDLETRLRKIYFPEHEKPFIPKPPEAKERDQGKAELPVDDDIFGDLGVKVS